MVYKFTQVMGIFFLDVLINVKIVIILVIESLALMNIFAVIPKRREHDL
jgi:hypothetical protein